MQRPRVAFTLRRASAREIAPNRVANGMPQLRRWRQSFRVFFSVVANRKKLLELLVFHKANSELSNVQPIRKRTNDTQSAIPPYNVRCDAKKCTQLLPYKTCAMCTSDIICIYYFARIRCAYYPCFYFLVRYFQVMTVAVVEGFNEQKHVITCW